MDIKIILKTIDKPEATLGQFEDCYGKVICKSLERPNNGNIRDNPQTLENDSGCIPEGTYKVIWSRSNSFSEKAKKRLGANYNEEKDSVWTYEVLNVPNRTGIRIHKANYISELLGCIAPCMSVQDMNPKQDPKIPAAAKWMASQSGDGLKQLQSIAGKEFELQIIRHS